MALTPEQRAIRKVGGSDVATILGLGPPTAKTALELYHEKRGTIEPIDLSDNLPVEAGNILEDGIAELAASHMARRWNVPVKLRKCNLTIIHPKYEWITAHIDRDVVGQERGVELKNVGARMWRGWGEQGTDDIPDYVLAQVHTYLLVKDYPVWTVASYFGGADLRLYEIERSREWDQLIIERTHEFWHENVLKGIPPKLDYDSPRAVEVVKRLYPGTDGSTVRADAMVEHWAAVRENAKQQVALFSKAADAADAYLLNYMGSAAILEGVGTIGQYTRKLVKRKAFVVEASEHIKLSLEKPK